MLGTRAVFSRPFDIVDQLARMGDAGYDGVVNLLRLHLQLVLHMERRSRDEGVDALARGGAQRLGGAVDVGAGGAGESGDDRVLDLAGNGLDRFEIAVRGHRKSGLHDDVDAHILEHVRDAQLLFQIHGAPGRLLAVAQGGVEYHNALIASLAGHDEIPSWRKGKRL